MKEETIRLSREQLFELVWEKPLSRLADELGVSDVGLAKMCKRLEVPRPTQGHWMRVRAGRGESRPALPEHSGEQEVSLPKARRSRAEPMAKRKPPAIVVPKQLSNAHPLVVRLEKELKGTKPDGLGLLVSPRRGGLVVEVSEENRMRALRIMNALLKALNERSIVAVPGKGHGSKAALRVGEEELAFSLKERLQRRDHLLTSEEQEREARTGWSSAPRYDFTPTGALRLQLGGLDRLGVRQSWSDGRRARLESKLGDVVLGVEDARAALEERRRHWAEQHRRWEEERQQRFEEEQRREEERRRVERLEALAQRWERSERLRRFLGAVEVAAQKQESGALAEWLEWGRITANLVDPIPAVLAEMGDGTEPS